MSRRFGPIFASIALFAPSSAVADVRPLSATAVASAATSTRAASAADVPWAVEEVRIVGRRVYTDPSATKSTVSRERLERARARGEDLGSVADTVAGARVLDLGGPVADRRLTVRGGAPSQALVVVDGVRQSSPFATGLDLGAVSLESVEGLELVRGGAGALYGDGALTGALVLTTARPRDRLEQVLLLSYGSFDTLRVAGRVSRRPLALTGAFEHTAGGFAYVSRLDGLPDVEATRENSDATRGTVALRAEHVVAGGTISVAGGASLRSGGLPGLETQPERTAREARATAHVGAAMTRSFGASSVAREVRVSVSTWLLDVDYENPRPERQRSPITSSTRFYTLGAEGAAALVPSPGHALRVLGSFTREQSDSTQHGAPSRLRASAAISDELSLGAWTPFGALRLDAVEGQVIAALPRAGVRFTPSAAWTFTLGAGRSVRAPAIDELHHPAVPGFSGNPALRSETAWEVEGSVGTTGEVAQARVVAFGRLVDDTIVYANRNAFEVRPENVGASRAAGLELEL
ncbi:TonB-dependent receptor, partial [Myxococcota bacterium]|nr:TonB-dependent receptor [Myxococcota bacterium]